MKYLVVKGWLGFGDRLESLKMCVEYALHHDLYIYVDWTDSTWSHGNETFYTYFNLVNMKTLKSLDEIPAHATVYPSAWTGCLKEPFSMKFGTAHPEINLNELGTQTFPADVLVVANTGKRTIYANSTFFANVFRVVDPRIRNEVLHRISAYNLNSCWGIHIRGTDRLKNQNSRDTSIRSMAVRLVSKGIFNALNIIAVSDDPLSTDQWCKMFPQTRVLSNEGLKHSSGGGNHTQTKDQLRISKDLMNVDMLVDFWTLACCNQVHSTSSDSRFAREAIRLHPFINQILG